MATDTVATDVDACITMSHQDTPKRTLSKPLATKNSTAKNPKLAYWSLK